MARIFCSHAPYPGQVATAGNFAMPFSPLEIGMGPVPEFCLYHLMTVDDPVGMFPIAAMDIHGLEEEANLNKGLGEDKYEAVNETKRGGGFSLASLPRRPASTARVGLPGPAATAGHVYLASLASVIRSKNVGPFEVTIDVMFSSADVFDKVKQSGVLTRESVVKPYGIDYEDIIACMWWEPAMAFKLIMKREHVSASFYDQDMHGSGKHVPLMYLAVPWET